MRNNEELHDFNIDMPAAWHGHSLDKLRALFAATTGGPALPRCGVFITVSLEFLAAHHQELAAFAHAMSQDPPPKKTDN